MRDLSEIPTTQLCDEVARGNITLLQASDELDRRLDKCGIIRGKK